MEEVRRQEVVSSLEYVWRYGAHEERMSAKQQWWKWEYLWVQVTNIARRCLVTQASSACSKMSFLKTSLICARRGMMLTPIYVDALSLLGWMQCVKKSCWSEWSSRSRWKEFRALTAMDPMFRELLLRQPIILKWVLALLKSEDESKYKVENIVIMWLWSEYYEGHEWGDWRGCELHYEVIGHGFVDKTHGKYKILFYLILE